MPDQPHGTRVDKTPVNEKGEAIGATVSSFEPAPAQPPVEQEKARVHDLRCARCCQSLPADLADRDALADSNILCGPACGDFLYDPAPKTSESELAPVAAKPSGEGHASRPDPDAAQGRSDAPASLSPPHTGEAP